MNAFRRTAAVVREAFVSAISSPIASIATVLMVAGMCATVLLTTGRTVGAEQSVLGSIDSAGTRTIVVRAEQGAGLDTSVLGRLATVEGIEWTAAFGTAHDVTNASLPEGVKVAARVAYGSHLQTIGIPDVGARQVETAWGTKRALSQLGLVDGSGSVMAQSGVDYTVVGSITLPPWLAFLEPVVVVPSAAIRPEPVAVLVVIADRPDLVGPVSSAVQSILAIEDPAKVTIATSEQLAELRALVEGQLGTFGRGLVLVVLSVSALMVAAILTGVVTLRRRDFGRRRALGATRSLIIGLLLTQTLFLACGGALLGTSVATIVLVAGRDPLPGVSFTVAVGVLAVTVSLAAALIPAIAAARRDPIRELRVP